MAFLERLRSFRPQHAAPKALESLPCAEQPQHIASLSDLVNGETPVEQGYLQIDLGQNVDVSVLGSVRAHVRKHTQYGRELVDAGFDLLPQGTLGRTAVFAVAALAAIGGVYAASEFIHAYRRNVREKAERDEETRDIINEEYKQAIREKRAEKNPSSDL